MSYQKKWSAELVQAGLLARTTVFLVSRVVVHSVSNSFSFKVCYSAIKDDEVLTLTFCSEFGPIAYSLSWSESQGWRLYELRDSKRTVLQFVGLNFIFQNGEMLPKAEQNGEQKKWEKKTYPQLMREFGVQSHLDLADLKMLFIDDANEDEFVFTCNEVRYERGYQDYDFKLVIKIGKLISWPVKPFSVKLHTFVKWQNGLDGKIIMPSWDSLVDVKAHSTYVANVSGRLTVLPKD